MTIYELSINELQQVAGRSDRPFKVLGIQAVEHQFAKDSICNELGLNPKDFDLTLTALNRRVVITTN